MAKKKNNKKHGLDIECPFCHTNTLVNTKNTKVKRFPKTHMIKFSCGFAFLYNTKTENIFTDVDWKCKHEKKGSTVDYKEYLKDVKKAFRSNR